MLTGAYQGRNQVILRAPFSNTSYFWPKIHPLLLPGMAEAKQNGRNLLQLYLFKLIYTLQVMSMLKGTYQGGNNLIFRSPAPETA